MAENYLEREEELFNLLTEKLNSSKNIQLNDSVIPNNSNNDNFKIYYSYNSPLWFIRIKVEKEVYYYFGLKNENSNNDNIFARLLIKVNFDYPKSIVKFYKNGRIGINLRIKDNNEEILNFFKDNFIISNYKKDKKKHLLYIIYKNETELFTNIENLITYFEIDLSPDKEYIVINNLLKSNEHTGIKINQKNLINPIILKVPKIKQTGNVIKKSANNGYANKFDMGKLNIITPSKYITNSFKNELKKNNDFLKLVTNFDEISYSRQVIVNNLDEIIKKANLNFIESEKTIKSSEFQDDLKNHKGVITEDDKEKLKMKYNEKYYDYYSHLNFNQDIDKYNKDIIIKEKTIFLNDFNEELNDYSNRISDLDRSKFRAKYNKDYFPFYDELGFDSLIDDFNNDFIKKERLSDFKLQVQMENNMFSIDDIITKIDCSLFSSESFEIGDLIENFEDYIESPIFDIISDDLDDKECSILIIKIKEDISNENISGDVADIIDFYFEQYASIKKRFSLNNFLNEYIISDDFDNLLSRYDYDYDKIIEIITHVRNDIFDDDSMDEDKVILKLEYYFKAETNKNDYFSQIDKIKDNYNYYIDTYNLIDVEFDDILNYIQIKINEGYHIKNIESCVIRKIKERIDINRNESRLKLKKVLNNQDFIEKNNITPEKLDYLNDHVGGLIYDNKIRSNNINEDFLLRLYEVVK